MNEHVHEIFFHRYTPQVGDTVVELGAFNGDQTNLLAEMVGPTGHVLAVEAHPGTFEALAHSVKDLRNVDIVCAAVTDRSGFVTLTDDGGMQTNIVGREGIEVPSITLDELTQNLGRIDFLKMNIEGSEAAALKGGTVALSTTMNVVVSCHDFIGLPTKRRVRALLRKAGFDVSAHSDPMVVGDSGGCLQDYLYAERVNPLHE